MADDTSLIGRGLTADVFALSDREVVKLFRADRLAEWVDAEFRRADAVSRTGLPTARVLRRELIDGRSGIVFERVDGKLLLHDITARPWRLRRHAVLLAWLGDQIGRISVGGLGSLKVMLHSKLDAAELSVDRLDRLRTRLDDLPDREATLCHLDFHPGNVILAAGGPVIIDWANARNGDHAADIAQTYVLLTCGAVPPQTSRPAMLRLGRRTFAAMFLRAATRRTPDLAHRVRQWLPVVAGARMGEHINGERDALLAVIEGRAS